MTQPNSAHLQQQQHSLQASNIANSTESLMSNAFDLIGGASAAQQFLSHMDLYRQQQQREHQQQLNYQYRQQQQELLSSLSSPQSIGSSSNSSSPSSTQAPSFLQQHRQHTPPTLNQHNHNFSHSLNHSHSHNHLNHFNSHHLNHTLKQQQHQPPPINNNQQQHYNTKHSISLTTSPIPSPTSLIATTTSSAASAAAAFAALTTSTSATLLNLKNSQQQSFNLHNNNHQMDVQLQQQSQLQNDAQATNNNGGGSSATIATSAGSPTSTASATLATTNSTTHQHQHHQHTHAHQHAGNSSPYKSCWCFADSVCDGIEVEIENNNNHFHGDSTYHMKILVPAVASGAIIGKGGETIAALQKDSGARVKMSKSHDFYPGTTERVCLITGSVDGIMAVLDFIMDKIREKPDLTTKIIDVEAKQSQERDKQVKILVPNSTAGMIIGKGGAYIKQIKEESGSYVQISQKPKDISLQERCITIIGDKENNKNACKMILSKIVEDPQSGTCLNVSYADINGPVANFNPTGSPYATNQNAINSSTASLNSTLGQTIGGAGSAAGLLVNGTGINLSLNLGSPNPNPNLAVATQLLEHIKVAMRGSGYSETATSEVCAALGVLAKYGVLGMGVAVPQANGAHTSLGSYLGVSALDQQTNGGTGNVFGAVGQVNLEQYAAAAAAAVAANRPTQSQLEAAAAAAQFDPFRHLSSAAQAATPVSLNNNSFGLTAATGTAGNSQQLGASTGHTLSGLSKSPTPGDLGAKDAKNVEIPEVIVGAILGPNGRSLVEIQHVSGANVQISKKGIFAPGTRNRIVTITGQQNAIAKAQYLIEQKINEEETKRARQIPLTTTTVVN